MRLWCFDFPVSPSASVGWCFSVMWFPSCPLDDASPCQVVPQWRAPFDPCYLPQCAHRRHSTCQGFITIERSRKQWHRLKRNKVLKEQSCGARISRITNHLVVFQIVVLVQIHLFVGGLRQTCVGAWAVLAACRCWDWVTLLDIPLRCFEIWMLDINGHRWLWILRDHGFS